MEEVTNTIGGTPPVITKMPAIYRAIAGVIEDVGAVEKNKVNKQQGVKFRSIDDVYNALHAALAKNKVFIVPEILEQTREVVGTTKNGAKMTQVICRIKYTFYAEDGSSVESIIIGEALDTGDKATNKAMAIAYKYACFQVFCIPTEEMVDPDAESPEIGQNGSEKQHSKKTSTKKQEHSGHYQSEAAPADPSKAVVTDVMVRTMNAELERTGLADAVLLKLFDVKALSEMSVAQFQKAMKKFEMTPNSKEEAVSE